MSTPISEAPVVEEATPALELLPEQRLIATTTLTAREAQVAMMLGTGRTNRQISTDLDISIKTVDTHRGHVLKKLSLANNVRLALYLVREGFVQP